MSAKTLFEGGASGNLFLERRQFYLDPNRVAELWPEVMPFTTLLQKLEVRNVQDTLYKMFEHRSGFVKQQFACNGSTVTIAANGDESDAITVDGITGLKSSVDSSYKGLEVEVWDSTLTTKKGVAIVTSAPSATTVKMKSLKASAISVVDNDVFRVIGNVRGEVSVAPEAFADELSMVWNSTQNFSVPVEISRKLAKASLRGYNQELARLRDEKAKEYKMQKENAFLKGVSVIGTNMNGSDTFAETNLRTITDSSGNSSVVRSTYGFIPILEDYGVATDGHADQNVFNVTSASYTYSDFVDDMEVIFDKRDSGEAFSFCGRGALSYWSKLDSSNGLAGRSGWSVQIAGTQKNQMGFNVRMLETPHGVLHLAPTKALRDQYNNHMALPHEQHIFMAQYEADEFKNNIKTNDDYSGVKDVYNGDQGFGMEMLEKHQLMVIK